MHPERIAVRNNSKNFLAMCEELLERGHQVRIHARGESMTPNIQDGDIVEILPLGNKKIRKGDIVLAKTPDGLKLHRIAKTLENGVVTRGDAGQEDDLPATKLLGTVVVIERLGIPSSAIGPIARTSHYCQYIVRRFGTAALRRLKERRVFLSVILVFVAGFAAFPQTSSAQTADLQLTQTASSTAVDSNATTRSLGTASTATWAGGVATFTFPTPLPSGVFTNALLTTTGFTPGAYNLAGASITSVNYAAGTVTVALANQSMGTATSATWSSANGGTASFTFPTPLPSEAVVGAQLTTTGFTSAAYNVTNATITSVNGGTGVVTVALSGQSLGTATAATWATGGGGHISFTFPTPLPSNAVVGGVLTTTGFSPAGYNVTNAIITSISAATGIVRVAAANPGAATALGTGTAGPPNSTTNGSGTVNPAVASTSNGTGTVPTGYSYTEVVTNNNSSATVASGTTTVYMQTPTNTVYESFGGTNWTCTTPAVGNSGPIICTYNATLASGATASTLSLYFQVPAGTAYGTTIQSSATVTNSTSVDTVPTNNTSITSIVVESTTTSDLALSMSVAPTPVFVSSTFTYTLTVQNLGQATAPATTNVLTDTLPAGLTNVAVNASSGWSCTGSATITCSSASLAMGATATIIITATSPTTATTLTNTASVSLPGDPNASNNSASTYTVVQPLVCATAGKDGAGGTLTGVVNSYYPPSATGTLASGSTSVALGSVSGAAKAIAAGDLLLVIQMQSASINSTNTSSYGSGLPGVGFGSTNLNSSGLFEFVTATNGVPVTGGTLQFTGSGANSGLLNSYIQSAFSATQGQQTYQVIRVPQYLSATFSSGLVPLAWNGSVGGVLAVDVSSQLTLGGTVAADQLGFRGAGGRILKGSTTGLNTDYVTLATNTANGSKGEGIAGTPRYLSPVTSSIVTTTTAIDTGVEGLPNGSYARGGPANAGGGGTDGDPNTATPNGNDENSGGGGGANGGTGGYGGYGWNIFTTLNSTDGGFGGAAFPASTSSLAMGGSGGAGSTNNGAYFISSTNHGSDSEIAGCSAGATPTCTGIFSSGGFGGGIVIVHTGSVVGTGTISSNGGPSLSVDNDGSGGGGSGGSILVFVNSGGLGGLTVNATGGAAGNTWPLQAPGGFPGARHGPGGGGGGGVIFLSAAPASSNVAGGANGFTNTVQDSYGATPGQQGIVQTTHIITETPGTQPGAYCSSADLAVTNSGAPSPVTAGSNITYAQSVTNNGPMAAVNAVFSEAIPANTTFQSLTVPGGWSCTAPAVGATGNISCTNPLVANAASSTFTLVVQVGAATPNQTQITDVASVTSGTNDPILSNNFATVVTIVGLATSADLTVTNTASPNPVLSGNNITYTQVVSNQGPAAALSVSFSEAIPTNTTFVSMPTNGWSCSLPAVGGTGTITCTIASLAAGASVTFQPVVKVTVGTASGTVISDTAAVNSSTPDPNPNSNSVTTNVIVATAGQADLAVSSSASPNPVLGGNNVTYAQSVTNNGPAASGVATFTDTIPTNTTFVSFVIPPSWNCGSSIPAVGGTGTISCSIASLAVNATASFPLVVKVSASTAAGTNISNTANINVPCSSASDPNCANNSATTTVTVASPSQADVAIVKTASPEPVDQGENLVYTLQVTNNGPATAQGVTVSDPLPAQVSYSSVSTTQGSCSQSAGTVSCNLGSINPGGLVIVTINVTANTFSSATTASNTATVSATTGDPNLTNNSSTAISTIQSPTAVQLVYFRAIPQGSGVLLEWKTRDEVRNLGFNVYREDATGRHRLNPSLIAGSALVLRHGHPQHAAKTYYWLDQQEVSPSGTYWLEDADLNGAKNQHGPAELEAPVAANETPKAAALITQMNSSLRESASKSFAAGIARPLFVLPPRVNEPTVQPAALDHLPAVKISVQSEGWYRVMRSDLVKAGLDPFANAQDLRLFAEGVEQPILILGNQIGPLGANGAIEFYGTGIDTPYSGTRVYWLVAGDRPGLRITEQHSSSTGGSEPSSFPATVVRQDRTTYFAALLNSEDQDNFFGALVTSEPVDQQLTVANKAEGSDSANLEITLQGVTDAQAHDVSILLNQNSIGTISFSNQQNKTATFSVSPGALLDGPNVVTLTALDGDNDVSLVQTIALRYAHSFTADSNWLRMEAPAGSRVHVTGFSNPQVRVFDITSRTAFEQLNGVVQLSAGSYSVDFSVPAAQPSGTHVLVAFTPDQLSAPSALEFHASSNLRAHRNGADVLIVTHSDFAGSIAPLARLRESQGNSVSVVTIDEIFDTFNYGERSPYAVRDFLKWASSVWRIHPQAVLLLGDASLDPRNYLGFGDFDFVPTRLIQTAALKTASDDWFTDFAENGFASIPVGRLPARTSADADLMVSKIVGYEQGAGSWNGQALVVADQNVGADFSTAANSVASLLSRRVNVTKILGAQADPATIKQQILDAINQGQVLVNYTGHGSVEQWSFTDLLDNSDVTALNNRERLPVFLIMDCLNGFFQDVYTQSLAESLLLAPNGGAVAVWASSGFTDAPPQAAMDQALVQTLATYPNMPLGRAILLAKKQTADRDVRRTWILFGDPSMRVHFSAVPRPITPVRPPTKGGSPLVPSPD